MSSQLVSDSSDELSPPVAPQLATFDDWTGGRSVAAIGTNAGSSLIPFQSWKRFKEAFAPELVREAVTRSRIPVKRLFDPFGGSGTSALAAQFLGVHPTTVEVNPYLADLIAAKLTTYDAAELVRHLDALPTHAKQAPSSAPPLLPATFVEPGVKGRYLFAAEVAREVNALNSAIAQADDPAVARFFRVALSGVLLDFCNARVNGKGRRYRGNWQKLTYTAEGLRSAFISHATLMISEIASLGRRAHLGFDLRVGDSRQVDLTGVDADLVVFSPPYPNSFDYTDVYNIELWMLGYLRDWADNGDLRSSTLASHVQISRDFASAPSGSETLSTTIDLMRGKRDELWNSKLPEMVAGYFADLWDVVSRSNDQLTSGGQIWMVVGDSRYSTIDIRVADILVELAPTLGLTASEVRPFRSMRASPQQGGRAELLETLIVLQKSV